MSIDLPDAAYDPARRAEILRRLWLVVAIVVSLLSGWQLFDLPGSPIKRNTAPPDMTGREYGLRDLYITADGTWTIYRYGFLDRMALYIFYADGTLERRIETPDSFVDLDVSGVSHGSPKVMLHHSGLDVAASPTFWYYVRRARPEELRRRLEAPAPQVGKDLPSYREPSSAAPEQLPHYVPVKLYYEGQMREVPVLSGHDYWPSYDSFAFLETSLWISTDRGRWLHLLKCDDLTLPPSIELLVSVSIDAGSLTDRDVAVGRDPLREQVFVLLANGQRYWYDQALLTAAGQDQLPGVWEPEYASLDFSSLEFNTDFGQPLSRATYARIMRSLTLLFLASLLSLAFLWRTPWKYISAATTADTNSGGKSSST